MTSPSPGPAESSIARAGSNRRSKLRRTTAERAVLGLGVIAMTMCLLTAGALAWGLDKFANVTKVDIAGIDAAAAGEPSNWLLVGTDTRDGLDPNDPANAVFLGEGSPEGKRTDTMIVARIDPQLGQIDLLSVPRDLYVPISGGGEGRVNSAFNGEGGEQRLVDTIETYFGFEINHYAEVNFVGFQDIVQGLGGVSIWFDTPMRDPGSGLDIPSAGCQLLDGFQALAFVRGRHTEYFADGEWHTDQSGDLGRSSRQQYFIRRVADTILQKINIAELGTLNNVLDIGGRNLVIDGGAEPGALLELAKAFGTISGEQIIGHALPVYDFRTTDGAAVLGLERDLAEPTLDIFRGIETTGVTAPPVPIVYRVSNGSRTPGQASEAAKAMSLVGMNVENIDNGVTTDRSVIRYPSSMAAGAEKLGLYLVSGPAYEIDETLTEVVLITGTDYQGLLETPRDSVELPTPPTTVAPAVAAPVETTPTSVVGVVPGPTPEGTDCQ